MEQKPSLVLYFAYGSNMSSSRIQTRIHDVKSVGTGVLSNYTFTCDKASRDGSGKGNIHPKERCQVWGVIFEVPETVLAELDEIEGGYQRKIVQVETEDGTVEAVTYVSDELTDEPPFDSYMENIIRGAQEHSLPKEYVDRLAEIPTKPDEKT